MSVVAGAGYGPENVDPQATVVGRQSAPSRFRPTGKQPKAFGKTALPAPTAAKGVQDSSGARLSSADAIADTLEVFNDASGALARGRPS